jgi:cytochrome c553
MRMLVWLLVAAAAQAPTPALPPAASAPPKPVRVGTMSELMVKIIYPTSDAVLYITTRTPKNDAEWNELQVKTLMLAESGNLLMMPGHARDQDRWMTDAKLMRDAGAAAFAAAKARDLPALDALNDQLYTSCVTCHQHYRPNYGKRR